MAGIEHTFKKPSRAHDERDRPKEDDAMRFTLHHPGRLWDPWQELSRLRDEMDRVFHSAPDGVDFPLINVTRLPDKLVIEAVAPGIDRSTLDVSTVGNTLTIRGERQPSNGGAKPEAYHRREREHGRFVRTVKLDDRVSTDTVTAAYRDGILRIELPYAPEAKPRRVAIES
jgi:HSP20 family protein